MLTRKDLDYLMSKDCEVGTFEGVNRTSTHQIEIINKKTGAFSICGKIKAAEEAAFIELIFLTFIIATPLKINLTNQI